VRPAFLAFVVSFAAFAEEDARVSFLTKQLAGSKDARVRAQTVLLLGQTGADGAVKPLCGALKDGEAVVRAAAASALGDLRSSDAMSCLKSALGESDKQVRAALEKALSQAPVTAGALYLQVEPVQDKVGGLSDDLMALADKLMREKLSNYGANIAPTNEDKKSAASLIRVKKLKGYQLRMQLLPGSSEKGLKVEMLIMSYPEQALKGTWNVKAAGGKPESLIKAMVPRVLDDAANDLEWKN
jgi:hypothetical protein